MSVLARLAGIEQHVAAVIAAHTAPRLTAVQLAEQAGIAPDPWQIDVLTSRSPRILLNIARQAGKSTVSAVLAVHTALAEPEALVLLLSPTLRQSGELFKKCASVYRTAESRVGGRGRSVGGWR